jgi:GTP cyclohydrolase IB
MNDLPDIQHTSNPEFPLYINQVGVSEVKAPFKLESMYGGIYDLVGTVEMTTDLKPEIKGISMGMLLRHLLNYLNQPLKHTLIKKILEEFKTVVETDSTNSMIKFEFELPIYKKAPKSNIIFPQFYKSGFIGKLHDEEYRFFQKVQIFYGSYCPCSASLCDHLLKNGSGGYPHAQRSYAELLVEIKPENTIWLESLIELLENSVKTATSPILRRVDEQEYARIAYENPMFVEDSVRRIKNSLNKNDLIYDWIVRCVHMESIHTNNAISSCWKGISNGFDGRYYL